MSFDFHNVVHGKRQTIRTPVSKHDKSTIVSIYPKEINEVKHTIFPGFFHIDAGSPDNPSLLVVGSSSWWREIDPEQPIIEIPQSSAVVADSLVRDFCNGLMGYKAGVAQPGLFYIEGVITPGDLVVKYEKEMRIAKERQKRYWENLVKITDSLWSRSNGNPLAIAPEAKLGAEFLGLKDKPWMKDFQAAQLVNCPACGTLRDSNYPMCQNCKTIIDPEKFKSLGLKTAS